jgi:hypothetical protein
MLLKLPFYLFVNPVGVDCPARRKVSVLLEGPGAVIAVGKTRLAIGVSV